MMNDIFKAIYIAKGERTFDIVDEWMEKEIFTDKTNK